jgi:hypothetical protein
MSMRGSPSRVEFGDLHIAAPLRLMTEAIKKVTLGLLAVEESRNYG